jgi:hypothetical protein
MAGVHILTNVPIIIGEINSNKQQIGEREKVKRENWTFFQKRITF